MDPLSLAIMAISSIFSVGASIYSSSENNDLIREQNESNRAYSNEMFDKNNEYNTPANQMGRMKDAGINPYFAQSAITAGSVQSIPQPSQMQQTSNLSGLPSIFSSLPTSFAILQQAQLSSQQANKTKVEAETLKELQPFMPAELKARISNELVNKIHTEMQNNLISAQVEQVKQNVTTSKILLPLQKQQLLSSIDIAREQTDNVKYDALLKKFNLINLQPLQKETLKTQLYSLLFQQNLINAQTSNVNADTLNKTIQSGMLKAQIIKMGKEISMLDLSMSQKKSIFEDVKEQLKNNIALQKLKIQSDTFNVNHQTAEFTSRQVKTYSDVAISWLRVLNPFKK